MVVMMLCWCWQDECTDAVSIDVEEGLYKSMSDAGVTIITISKYAALKIIGIFCCNFDQTWLTFFATRSRPVMAAVG